MPDAVVISDIHLGSDNCQAEPLVRLLDDIRHGVLPAGKLILNGDVFDSIDFRRLRKHHWRVLSILRKLSDRLEVVWLTGNHDGSAEIVSHLLGVTCLDETIIESGGRRILLLHGHRFDEFIDRYPLTTWVADLAYRILQKLDGTHTMARRAKRGSKIFLRSAEVIRAGAVEYAKKLGCDAVCCGHTHLPAADESGPVAYYNSGCWTEKPCHYVVIDRGAVEVRAADAVPVVPVDLPTPLPMPAIA